MDSPPPTSVAEYLTRNGAFVVLYEVASGAKRFNEIEDSVNKSSRTLSNRLQDGTSIDLWEKKTSQKEAHLPQRYWLTDKGQRVWEKMQDLDYPHHLVKYRTYRDEKESREEQLQEWVEEKEL
ncbi:winged helix-turn-helix transcriptional regulator [Halocalculus aciditolerans]|uniref:HTH hxlR-type domain-containing protein n=1 Tax=Halocalculus aciditolerans TaxID=1383812 RepID=A0A830FPB3_9EURY|nr:winged helix-turn-helix transcriptional regulator [Halocalculus aciditolerans]GGL67060.1 hypothetical protein GCM10009039_26330 [Halocalculus aciditolerans]